MGKGSGQIAPEAAERTLECDGPQQENERDRDGARDFESLTAAGMPTSGAARRDPKSKPWLRQVSVTVGRGLRAAALSSGSQGLSADDINTALSHGIVDGSRDDGSVHA